MFLPAPWMDGPPRNFDWPGPSPWKGKQGWVVVEIDAATGYKQVYGLQHGPTYDEDQLIFWDLEPTNSEIAQLQALPDTLHCPQFPHLNIEMGQIGAGEPPADDGNPFPGAIAACVPHAVFTQVDATCAAGPPPAPCVPRKCSPFMRGTVPDGCGGELCCQPAGSKGHYCE